MLPRFLRKKNRSTLPSSTRSDATEVSQGSVDPISKKTPDHDKTSATTKVALKALLCALQLLGTTPCPGIATASATLIKVINGIRDTSDAKAGWKQLTERMERLWFLVSQLTKLENCAEQLIESLNKELQLLAEHIKRASAQHRLHSFLNSSDDLNSIAEHRERLDSLIIDLTATICTSTNQTASQLLADFQNEISRVRDRSSTANGITVIITNSLADGVDGDFGADNKVLGKAIMSYEVHNNNFGHVLGSMFSRNVIEDR